MGILGKLLIVLNLLAAGAFTYVTLGNWKTRQEITRAAISREVALRGLPQEGRAATAEEKEAGRVPFQFEMPGGLQYETVEENLLKTMVPTGDQKLGGEAVANQTDEVKRVQKKVAEALADEKLTPADKVAWIKAYLLAVARTGAERDGVTGLFDLLDPSKKDAARRDLPSAARLPSQVAALRILVDIADLGDPQGLPETARDTRISQAREAKKRFLFGEAEHGAKGDSPGARDEAVRNLRNAVDDALKDRAGEAEKKKVTDAATADPAGWAHLANLAVEPLADKPSTDRAKEALLAYAQGKAVTETEKAALAGMRDLIVGLAGQAPPPGFDLTKSVEATGTNLLNARFEEAALPAVAGKQGAGPTAAEKARRIAHLLYHIDGWRHGVNDQAVAADHKAWHQRVVAVVGMPEYIRAAETEATEYAEDTQRLLAAITEEQSTFEAEWQALVQRVQGLYAQWLALDDQLKAQNTITMENERLYNERMTERNDLKVALEKAVQDAKAALDRLQANQDRLYKIQKDLRNAQAAILAMEKELRRIELGPEASPGR